MRKRQPGLIHFAKVSSPILLLLSLLLLPSLTWAQNDCLFKDSFEDGLPDASCQPNQTLPPDPSTVAPPVNQSVTTTVGTGTGFLYTGANPIQTGVAPGAIDPKRAALLRGRVLTKTNAALPGVTVSIVNHTEFGQTLSRADGRFDLVVNGGAPLTIHFQKVGLIGAQRQVQVPWQNYVAVPDVVMIPLDAKVTSVNLAAPGTKVARGNPVTDASGTRQATMIFPEGTQATLVLANGGTQPLTSLSVRATEFTVGTNGPNAMPAELPPTSGYTYAAEFSADEAANARELRFSQPVPVYVDNFLNFPIGIEVPLGSYDRQKSAWIASDNGRVVKIISISGGLANLDTDGNGTADNTGIASAERQQLASLYSAGKSLWRMPIPHFSPWDANWPFGPPPDAEPPAEPPPQNGNPPDDCDCEDGSIVQVQGQILGERVAVVGTPFSLYYQSDRVDGRKAARSLTIPLSGATLPPSTKSIELEVTIAGQISTQTFPATPNQKTTFLWDGKDVYGRDLQGRQTARVRVGYTYDGVYQRTDRFGYNGNGIAITGSRTRQEVTLGRVTETEIGAWDARGIGLGGWTLDIHHVYDPNGQVLYQGDGARRSVQTLNAAISTLTGTGAASFSGDGGPAAQAAFNFPLGVAAGPDGTLYIADTGNRRVRKIAPTGVVTTVAGTGAQCAPTTAACGDGGPASAAQLHSPVSVAVGPDGSLYIQDPGAKRTRKVATNGVITTVAGTGQGCASPTAACGDGGPATAAQFGGGPDGPQHIAVTPDGTLYITDGPNHRVRRVGADGIVSTIAGSGLTGCANENVNARAACLDFPWGVAVAADGAVYFTDSTSSKLFRVGVNGVITRISGNFNPARPSKSGGGDDGGPAIDANLCSPEGLVIGPDGTLYFADWCNNRIRKIGTDGIINSVAGNGIQGFGGDGGPALRGQIRNPVGVALGPDGTLYIADGNNQRIRKVSPPLPGFSNTDIVVVSLGGKELYQFNGAGQHLRTQHALTGATLFTFAYDSAGRLGKITDGSSNITTIQRAANGSPTGILGPFGQTTMLTVDANGYLASIKNPANQTHLATYSADGLLLSFKDPKNNLTTMTYDSLGRLAKDSDAAGGSQSLARTDLATGYQVKRTTGLSRVTTDQVEELASGDRQRTNTLPTGLDETLLQGADGVATATAADGTVTTTILGADPRFALQAPILANLTIVTPGGLNYTTSTTRTAALSNPANILSLTSQTDTTVINGRTYTEAYNAATKTTTYTSPQNRQNIQAIDALGRTTKTQVGDLLALNFAYDARGRLASLSQGSGAEQRLTTYSYNPQGYLASIADPLGRSLAFTYDAAGRVLTQTLPNSQIITLGYDANGNLASLTPPSQPAHVFTYSPLDLLSKYAPPSVAGGGTNQTTYAYNLDRQIDLVTRPDGLTLDFAYDGAGRVSTLTTPAPAGVYTYGYNPASGNLASIAAPGGLSLAYAYDGALLKNMAWSGAVTGTVARTYDNNLRTASLAVNGGAIAFGYDNDGLLTQAGALALTRDPQHGLVSATTLNTVTDAWNYNGFGELVDYNARAGVTTLYSAQYTRDGLGRISQKVETIGGVTATFGYDYDAAGRLSEVSKNSAVTATYTYDANGNRLSGPGLATPPTYDDQDRLLAYAGNTYTYTANGELATKVVGGNTTTYQYDVLGNLRAVTLPGNVQIQYLIDGQNRRIGKRVGGALTQGFLYEDELRIAAELSGANAVVSRFIYASRANVPDYLTKGGVTYRVITDHLGSVRLVVNAASGAVAQRLDYDEFGKVTLDTSPGFQPFGFAGGLYDKDTKLVRFGARDYDAETGRWTLKDPLYFAGRDSNLYAYALGNPITYADPSGLWPKGPVEWAQWLAKNTALQHKEARKKQLEEELKDANCKDREKKQEELNNLDNEIAKLKQELDQLWNPPATPEPTTNNPPGQQGSGSNPLWDWYLKWNDSHQIK